MALGPHIARGYAKSLENTSPVAAYLARALIAVSEESLPEAIAILVRGLERYGDKPEVLSLLAQLGLAGIVTLAALSELV